LSEGTCRSHAQRQKRFLHLLAFLRPTAAFRAIPAAPNFIRPMYAARPAGFVTPERRANLFSSFLNFDIFPPTLGCLLAEIEGLVVAVIIQFTERS
jgi:hypothetical protein